MGGWGWRRLLGFGIALGIELDWGGLEHGGGYGGRDGEGGVGMGMGVGSHGEIPSWTLSGHKQASCKRYRRHIIIHILKPLKPLDEIYKFEWSRAP